MLGAGPADSFEDSRDKVWLITWKISHLHRQYVRVLQRVSFVMKNNNCDLYGKVKRTISTALFVDL